MFARLGVSTGVESVISLCRMRNGRVLLQTYLHAVCHDGLISATHGAEHSAGLAIVFRF